MPFHKKTCGIRVCTQNHSANQAVYPTMAESDVNHSIEKVMDCCRKSNNLGGNFSKLFWLFLKSYQSAIFDDEDNFEIWWNIWLKQRLVHFYEEGQICFQGLVHQSEVEESPYPVFQVAWI